MITMTFLDDVCEWKCTHCDFKTHGAAVRKIFATIQEDIDRVEYLVEAEGKRKLKWKFNTKLFKYISLLGVQERETLYKKYKSVLHPKNSYMNILRSALVQLYGKADGYSLDDLPDIILERKVELCNQLLEVLDVIEPGRSRIRGRCMQVLKGYFALLSLLLHFLP